MNDYANVLKETLTSLIREMAAAPYVKNPETNFTRKKKLPFETCRYPLTESLIGTFI
ncbi:MAG: hypothetical protein K0Q90_4294 [Paenibacillaceae bacterium]|jgi:hypothetical protein|nr:hypothetical protein [Paenibacillaceae bacterium]